MTNALHFAQLPLVHALGWMLLHFVWQGAIVALLLALALKLLPLRVSKLRYAIACGAMVWMVTLPGVTFFVLATSPAPTPQSSTVIRAADGFGVIGIEQPARPWMLQVESLLDRSLPLVIDGWVVGVLLLLCRLNLGLMATRRMRFEGLEVGSADLQHTVRALRIRLGIDRAVGLVHSARVQAPAVIGWLKPVILLPVGCMTGLSTLQVEAILAHELAHIRRHDYLISLLQSVVETLLFYHPAVWWMSDHIRREREHCCDDLAVTVCGDRLAYAKALTYLEERRGPIPTGAFAANGGVLKRRIARLLSVDQPPAFPRTAAALLLMIAATTAALAAWGVAHAQSPQLQQAATQGQRSSVKEPAMPRHPGPSQGVPVRVRSLTIESSDLPEGLRLEIVRAFEGGAYPLDELMERIRQELRDRGYVDANVAILKPSAAPSGPPPQPVDVSARIAAGAQYRFGGISVEGAHAFSEKEVVRQFPLHSGDLFNATAIGKGLDRLKQLYASKGYVHFGAIPRLKMDEASHKASLMLDIREGHATAAN